MGEKSYQSEYFIDLMELLDIILDEKLERKECHAQYFSKLEQLECRNKRTVEEGSVISLEYLFHVFELDKFERHCVRLALVPELQRRYELAYQSIQQDASLSYPTVDFCIQSFADNLGEVYTLAGNFRERVMVLENLFCLEANNTGTRGSLSAPLRLKKRILDFILNKGGTSCEIGDGIDIIYPGTVMPNSVMLYSEQVSNLVSTIREESEKVLCCIEGKWGMGKKTVVTQCMKELGYPLLLVDLSKIWNEVPDFFATIRQIGTEAVLRQADLCFNHVEVLLREENSSILESMLQIIWNTSKEVFLLSESEWNQRAADRDYRFVKYKLELPNYKSRLSLWERFLEREETEENVNFTPLAERYHFTPGQIREAVEISRQRAAETGMVCITQNLLRESCQNQIKYSFGENVTYIQALYRFEHLILPPKQMQILKNVCARMTYKRQVYEEWGFDKKVFYGKGVSMLFCGSPGTGKTMSAQVIANELQMELYKVDLSMITSKYIGETEKNLKKIFEEGRKGPVILFFDEADALFGKRSEVKDAHDKYANFETSYLLQMMEEYEGVVILATNFVKNFDEAFKRRIKFIVDFPFPGEEERLKLWKSIFPEDCPVGEEIDFEFLAKQYELSGSSIKDIAISAAFMAAQKGKAVDMGDLLSAVEEEMKKTGKILGKEDFGEYYTVF